MTDDNLKAFAGRHFRLIDFDLRTVLQDAMLQKALQATGVDAVMPMDGDDDSAYTARIQESLNDSLRQFELLATFLMPDRTLDTEFSPAIAGATAQHLERVTAPAEREQLMPIALEGIARYVAARRRTVKWFPHLFTRRAEKKDRRGLEEQLADGLGLGEWSEIVRACAGYDYDRARCSVQHWPLTALLCCYQNILRDRAHEQYRHDVLIWAALAPHMKKGKQPPKLPGILTDRNG